MGKSLIELLEDERRAVYEEKLFTESIKDFESQVKEGQIDKESGKRIIENYKKELQDVQDRMVCLKREIKEYFSFIEKI